MMLAYFLMGLSVLTGVCGVAVHRESMLAHYPLRGRRTYRFHDHFNLLMFVLIGVSSVSGGAGAIILAYSGGPLWCSTVMFAFIIVMVAAGWYTQFVFGSALKRQYDERNYSSE